MFLLALSAIFGYGIVFERIPEVISTWMLGVTDNAYVVMVLIVLFILLAGTFMEGSVLIIMLTPIFLPLVTKYGIDPVHFGLVFIIAATIGNYTPPVGGAMFVVCQVLRCPIGEYTRESVPFLIAVSLVTLLLDLRARGRAGGAGSAVRQGLSGPTAEEGDERSAMVPRSSTFWERRDATLSLQQLIPMVYSDRYQPGFPIRTL